MEALSSRCRAPPLLSTVRLDAAAVRDGGSFCSNSFAVKYAPLKTANKRRAFIITFSYSEFFSVHTSIALIFLHFIAQLHVQDSWITF